MGLTLSKKSLIPGWDRSSIRKLIVGIGQSGRGGVGGGGGMGKAKRDHLIERMMKSCDTIHNAGLRGYDSSRLRYAYISGGDRERQGYCNVQRGVTNTVDPGFSQGGCQRLSQPI